MLGHTAETSSHDISDGDDDQMNEKSDDIAHPDIVSKPLQTSDIGPIQ